MSIRPFRIGIPNTGRLSQLARGILADNLDIASSLSLNSRSYVTVCFYAGFHLEIIAARSEDLPRLLDEEVIDICITGKDYVEESGVPLVELLDLELCPGIISLLVSKESSLQSITDLAGITIATQLPNISEKWLKEKGIDAKIRRNTGANEVYPYLGLAEATIDVVSSGATAISNHMKPIIEILPTSGRLFTSQKALTVYPDHIEMLKDEIINDYLRVR